MNSVPTLTTRDIGEAENALRANLSRIIDSSGLTYGHWVALQMITNSQSRVTTIDLYSQLAKAIKIDGTAAQALLDDLQAKGVLNADVGTYSLSESGTATFKELSDRVQEITKKIFAELDASDLVAAHRVLLLVTERANNLLVGK